MERRWVVGAGKVLALDGDEAAVSVSATTGESKWVAPASASSWTGDALRAGIASAR